MVTAVIVMSIAILASMSVNFYLADVVEKLDKANEELFADNEKLKEKLRESGVWLRMEMESI